MSNQEAVLAAPTAGNELVTMGFGSLQSFEFMQRTAKLFAASTMVPTAYQAIAQKGYGDRATFEPNPAALSNCVIALDMSQRMNANPLMIMQNLHIIEGRPSWSSQFIIAAINNCGKFSPLRFDLEWLEEIDAEFSTFEWQDKKKVEKKHTVKIRDARCVAWATEKATGERIESAPVTMAMAVAEGWFGKNGSKWKSMPDLMMRYRTAAFFGRIYAPELLMGLPASEEIPDIIDVHPQQDGTYAASDLAPKASTDKRKPRAPTAKATANAAATADATDVDVKDATPAAATVDQETGEVTDGAQEVDENDAQEPESPTLSPTKMDWIKSKLEEAALSSKDFIRFFKFQIEDARESDFDAIRAWVKNPA